MIHGEGIGDLVGAVRSIADAGHFDSPTDPLQVDDLGPSVSDAFERGLDHQHRGYGLAHQICGWRTQLPPADVGDRVEFDSETLEFRGRVT